MARSVRNMERKESLFVVNQVAVAVMPDEVAPICLEIFAI